MSTAGYRETFDLPDYPEALIERIIRYRLNPYGITEPYLSYEEIAAREQVTPEDVCRILRATAIIWGH